MTSTQASPGFDESSSLSDSASRAESRGERFARGGRRVRLYTGAVVFLAVTTVLIALSSVNTAKVKLDWVIGSTHASLVWILLATAVIGWLLGITTAVVFRFRTREPR